MSVFITGDKHANFSRLEQYLNFAEVRSDDIVIILGDVSCNYFDDERDNIAKEKLAKYPCEFLCIHGNHEMRPWENSNNYKKKWNNGEVYVENCYPNILYAVDGSIFNVSGENYIALGGAYSVDEFYLLERGYRWFGDEQPTEEIKKHCEMQLEKCQWKVDYVLSHTSPFSIMPRECFLEAIDKNTVDNSTELWLDSIEKRLNYKKWYCGHFHVEKKIDKTIFLYESVMMIN